jgi:hypothetical protein
MKCETCNGFGYLTEDDEVDERHGELEFDDEGTAECPDCGGDGVL